MMNLPQPKPGEITALTIATPDLAQSLAWYQRLGFSEVMRLDFPFPWIQISDGALLIMLRQDPARYLALTYYVNDIAAVTAELRQQGITFSHEPKAGDFVKRYIFESPDGLTISLVNMMEGFRQPPGPTMLRTAPQDMMKPELYVNKTCGMFGELAHPVRDLDATIAFWEKLGFKALSRFTSPYPWAILSDGLAVVGAHQTPHFPGPAITYFAADMQSKIEALKAAGLENYREQGPGNIVLTTPEQQTINLFSMGM